MYKPILNTFAGLMLSVAADVPALINYQGRLVDGVGNPIVGKKEFKLDIYDSQTEGTLIYQETLPDITLDEDGAYSFQFGAGESRSETSVVIATGDGEAAFFQKVFEQTPVGVISVTDGTNTFKTGDVPTGDEPFSFTYTASLKRLNLVCNEPPAEGVKFTATFRYAESGIMGALGSAAEHWMEVTIGGDKQEPRQRLVAVPFALRAGVSSKVDKSQRNVVLNRNWGGQVRSTLGDRDSGGVIFNRNFQKVGQVYQYIDPFVGISAIEGIEADFQHIDFTGNLAVTVESKSQGGAYVVEWEKTKFSSSETFEYKNDKIKEDDIGLILDDEKEWRIGIGLGPTIAINSGALYPVYFRMSVR
ncbi:hypothetical protein N8621_02025 [Akkermansiaceae bacterium]|nr:hypothetical protein [Akkermansiaceae bacterium]